MEWQRRRIPGVRHSDGMAAERNSRSETPGGMAAGRNFGSETS